MEFYAEFISIILNTVAAARTHFNEVINLFGRYDTFGIVYISVRTGEGNNFSTQFGSFFTNTPANVTETGSGNCFAFNVDIIMFEYVFQVVNSTVTRCFRTDKGTAVAEAFTCENAVFESAF